ncbi:MAG: hypothetical protein ACD_7C00429G0006 [uncultured bacterium]|nr:MAG: hypothetical protein ACD_7C00429G0006 [uncultured bacterium]KKP68047.1 MAG: hypothetical protein UR66_C0009G0137 [Candidatus Moranbacteria bacterium GW2011_GWE1_35_17]KKP70481.1 MAG: hypothetical protein UR65_C0040G0004 [Candidatus Moranbacteria bacterium GW2011_GWE2_35_164]KKP81429.1 MAG: hypothetical protein UR82_C0064G0011 [Candidatus Moranbacteria bacterium GW2011_GWF1_35_5]KKP84963.1 MAG: hypothetical protein UR83_C0007G0009 [Candidatus Moranbacteria bacterium GW2011_GWF2_35_54]HB
MSELFNLFNKQYKKVDDLPEEHKKDFVNIANGFIKKEAVDKILKREAMGLFSDVNSDFNLARLESE